MEKMTYREALEAGVDKYWSGKPCKRGHVSMRYLSSGTCIECNRLNGRRRSQSKYVTIKIKIHRDDAELIRQTAHALNAVQRGHIVRTEGEKNNLK